MYGLKDKISTILCIIILVNFIIATNGSCLYAIFSPIEKNIIIEIAYRIFLLTGNIYIDKICLSFIICLLKEVK